MLRILPKPGLQHGENLVHGWLLHILDIHIITVGTSDFDTQMSGI